MKITRRQTLKALTSTGIGVAGLSGVEAGYVRAESSGTGPNCHKDFTCDDDTTYVKYELVERDDGTCYFKEETDTDIFADSLTITETKDGDSCEPMAVSWDGSEYIVQELLAYGGQDCELVPNPGDSYDADPDSRDSEPNNNEDAGLDNSAGNPAAISNLQFCVKRDDEPECPSGTRSLASYSVDDNGNISFDNGEDVVEFSNQVSDSDGLKKFDFESIDGSDADDEPEVLTTVTVEYGNTIKTLEVDPDFDDNKQSGSVDLSGQDEGIERILFCQAVYAQADFVTGDVIDDLCTNQYSSRKISSITWSSYKGQLDGVQGQFDGSWNIGTDTVTVDYNPDSYNDKLTLAVYEVSDPVFQGNNNIDFGATRCRQTLVDSDSDEVGSQDGELTADLPSP